ncbi:MULTISPECIES: cobalamin biosynthesis protein [Pseudomonas]|uniref:Cobalamin biosynthesis protein CobE n=2 Tax=Pseudomonadaceae TaxID=135621 RepID=A0A0D0KH48_9PSED|nr:MULTISPECIES: cobalamin biosynthesis protein [Pseudomonas]KIP96260.1 cobalamin biosynthesis protein CobE [Pseudomonas fulva]MCW2289974.1 cobalt-precorrin 5A hydrolase [Pseudomonas sp. BIGb0408]NYH75452.1 cobalt-precorrin 5A hydrolase [Pseudomonas flavescens]
MNERSTLVAGLGCRRGCSLSELLALLDDTLAEHGSSTAELTALASSDHKADEPGLLQLAEHLGLPISFLPTDALTGYHERLSQTSAIALHVTGSPSVAEASALALVERLSNRPARLWITKRKSANATLAVARSDP